MKEIKSIEEWKKQVNEYLNSLNHELQKDEKAKELYYGFDVIDGMLIKNPLILFVGINPGKGNGERHFEVKMESNRISYLDVFNTEVEDKYDYPLAKNTIKLLIGAGYAEDEIIKLLTKSCVKTNLYHVITDKEDDIKNIFGSISSINIKDYYDISSMFCVELIKLINPKIVIFEGKSAYNQIVVECYEEVNSWDENLGFGHFYDQSLDLHLIGYARTYSNINSIDNVASKLKEVLI